MEVKPFKISIPDTELEFLRQKLLLSRLPTKIATAKWTESDRNYLTVDFLDSVLSFWLHEYSWRSEEAVLNRFPQFITPIQIGGFGDVTVHFIHSRSSSQNSIPLLFLHGWPGSIIEISKALQPLNEAGFHVVAPSLPGWLFSPHPEDAGFTQFHHAETMHKLMLKLGYNKYVLQGGDWGGETCPVIAANYPDHVLAMHVNNFPMPEPKFDSPPQYTPFEQRQLAWNRRWVKSETAYLAIQTTKPLSLGVGLHDSPMGLLAWIADKLFVWSDSYPRNPDGYKWSHTELITWTLLHYFAVDGPMGGLAMYAGNPSYAGDTNKKFVSVPTGVSAFAGEAEMVPRSWAEKRANIVFWREHDIGGHFAMYERPKDMVEDIVDFVKGLDLEEML